jgi:hypothetical protein
MARCSQLATPNGLRLDQLLMYCWIFLHGVTNYEGLGTLNLSAHNTHLANIIQFVVHGWVRTTLNFRHP